ncbi:AAA family ATPase [Nitrosomonas sp.]|uniref:ATP-binding protein n=1 Tax=Nitrosomonas sp. TaxID=42353 RepID=UPI0025EAAF76|nr:AAA family ATPase [Nitrosomonas sp.]
MRIDKISSRGTVAINEVDIEINSPITLVCGANRAGKSSLYNGIRHAFTGVNPCEPLKKNYGLLINRADDNNVGYTFVDYNDNQRACITLPNGTHELTEQLPFALPYLLNPSLFAASTTDERRQFLFNLGNLRSDGAEVREKLLQRGCSEGDVDEVLPFLKSSFDNANKHAMNKIKEARANWKATAGEVYGDKKAEGWKAQKPEIDNEAATVRRNRIVNIDDEIEDQVQKLGAIQAEVNGVKARNSEVIRLRDIAEKTGRIEEKLKKDQQEVIVWIGKVNEARLFATGSAPGSTACKCPECDAELVFNGKELLKRNGDLHGDDEAAVKLPEYEKTLTMLRNAVANGERDLQAAITARDQLAVLEKQNGQAPNEDALIEIKTKIESLKATRKQLQDELNVLNQNINAANEADKKTKQAARYHEEAKAWDLIANALSPEGIPSEMLSAALDPVNARIACSIQALNFPGKVRIENDMTIMEDNGKLYSFSSKATKLLIDSMIAEAISYVSGIKFFMIDEWDLLDMPSRSTYLNWLIDLSENNEIDSVILFGTLKMQPTGLPSTISSFWIENGVVQDRKAEAA